MQTAPSANGYASVGVNFGMTVLCIFPTWIVLSELKSNHEVQEVADTTEEEEANKI
jgi:hypothetical protein